MGERSRSNLEFEYCGFKFIAYWCLTEGSTKFFPRVKALVKTPHHVFRSARNEGIKLLQRQKINFE